VAQAAMAARWSDLEVHINALVIEFGPGCFVYYVARRYGRTFTAVGLAASGAFFFSGAYFAEWGPIAGWLRLCTYGIGAALLIYAASDRLSYGGGRLSLFLRYPQYAGDASYSLYLWHLVILVVLVNAADHSGLIASLQ
jgi:peptidoglycan/LPS O-acetylase OafA/YrhL